MENKRKGLSAGGILGILALVLGPLMLAVLLTPGGGGLGDYTQYGGRCCP